MNLEQQAQCADLLERIATGEQEVPNLKSGLCGNFQVLVREHIDYNFAMGHLWRLSSSWPYRKGDDDCFPVESSQDFHTRRTPTAWDGQLGILRRSLAYWWCLRLRQACREGEVIL